MRHARPIAAVFLALTTALLACGPRVESQEPPPEPATVTPERVESSPLPETPPATDTLEPTPTETPTPTIPPTEVPRLARVLENTNCRTGPGTVYDNIFSALKGTELPIVGRTTLTDYVIVAYSANPSDTCWLWTRYVDVRGDLTPLPLFTPPPTPTPAAAFTLSYSYLEGCVGWDPGFKVVNTGSIAFKSAYITAKDTVTGTTVQQGIDVFDKRNGCAIATAIPVLNPGQTGYVYANTFVYDPTGNKLDVTVKLCSGAGQTGTCVSRSISATP
ncbi:MAG TPA: hypothetical protein VLL77_05255 [Anaerolineales bacterium]|nr:hypothetical protein [Anaerolineales bacterium]